MLPLVPFQTSENRKVMFTTPWGRTFERIAYHRSRQGFKQTPPFDVDTKLYYQEGICFDEKCFANMDAIPYTTQMVRLEDTARNNARAKFMSQVGSASQLGSTLTAELRATYGTVVGGVAKALQAARLVRKGKLLEAGELLGFNPPTVRRTIAVKRRGRKPRKVTRECWRMPDSREVLKGLGNRWLWYSYGVKPLIEDIYNASQVFTREVPGVKIVGRGVASGNQPGRVDRYEYEVSAKVSAYVKVGNPNRYLASQLGLLNPVQWFNEGVTLSFVIDWFSNWSDWIMQLTDLEGLELTRPNTSTRTKTVQTWSDVYYRFKAHFLRYERVPVFPGVKLQFAYERFAWQRGANAISLLVGFLKNQRH